MLRENKHFRSIKLETNLNSQRTIDKVILKVNHNKGAFKAIDFIDNHTVQCIALNSRKLTITILRRLKISICDENRTTYNVEEVK